VKTAMLAPERAPELSVATALPPLPLPAADTPGPQGNSADIRINRLPTLEVTASDPIEPEAAPEIVPVPTVSLGTRVAAIERPEEIAPAIEPPVKRFAASLPASDEKPRMAIVLMDDGVDIERDLPGLTVLRGLSHPVSIAVDATLPDAAERMRLYRDAGHEVLATVNFPDGARAPDADVWLTAALEKLPEALGVLEGAGTGVQTSRDAAAHVSTYLAGSGHGFVAQDRGLNSVQKLAARAGVPSAVVFRDFDAGEVSSAAIRRFLDQAVFRAAQEGRVVMLGRLRPDTITALMLWELQDAADRVALVPVSRVLEADAP
jgi:polysaccharide deacetylase 2 family uncharacterized protein YibQ